MAATGWAAATWWAGNDPTGSLWGAEAWAWEAAVGRAWAGAGDEAWGAEVARGKAAAAGERAAGQGGVRGSWYYQPESALPTNRPRILPPTPSAAPGQQEAAPQVLTNCIQGVPRRGTHHVQGGACAAADGHRRGLVVIVEADEVAAGNRKRECGASVHSTSSAEVVGTRCCSSQPSLSRRLFCGARTHR